jgi:hypothetical protein
MSSETGKYLKFGGAVALILVSMGYLAYTWVQESKSYYVTIKDCTAWATALIPSVYELQETCSLVPSNAAGRM